MGLTLLCCFVAVFLLVFGVARSVARTRMTVAERVQSVAPGRVRVGASATQGTATPRRRPRRKSSWVRLEVALRQAEIDLTAREFALRWLLITACAAMVVGLLTGPVGALFAVAASAICAATYLRLRSSQRGRRFDEGLHDALTMVVNSLRSGHSFVQSIQSVATEMSGPIHDEFERIVAETQVGVELEEALRRAVDRVRSEDFDLVVTAIVIQRQVGGNLSEVLEQIAQTIRERVQLKREVKALTAQGRLSAIIFMALPIGVAAILFMMNPTYIEVLFQNPIGIAMLVAAALGQLIGYVIIRRIVNVEL